MRPVAFLDPCAFPDTYLVLMAQTTLNEWVWPVFLKHERDRGVRIQVVSEASLVNVRIKGRRPC